ncbi:UPF0220 domain protein [Microthyrium microscopicum]|uniref:UPF0220 domain protein n=1 Tax=Microthyrium microscopicum TaxID=703497 RepID=A0A6A6UJN3_9PEZI|nr:UPF0220 domain protein [Microthyrium microscopicum]
MASVYASGGIFALSLFFVIDAASFSRSNLNASDFHVTFVDWIPLICAVLGMLVINSIDKTRLGGDSFSYSGNGVAWKARLILFLGFALLAGGLAGSITVLVLKYVMRDVGWPTLWFGVAGVFGSAGVMASSTLLWVAQNMEDEYTYNLAL